MDVGELIRKLRTAHGWSQARLADEINAAHGTTLTRKYVARWERGKVTPRGFYLAALSRALDVPLAVLEDPMLRRTFLTDAAGTAIAPLVASDLLARGFAARLSGGPFVETWEDKLAAYGTDYMSMGPPDIQRRVAGGRVTTLCGEVEEVGGRAGRAVGGELAAKVSKGTGVVRVAPSL